MSNCAILRTWRASIGKTVAPNKLQIRDAVKGIRSYVNAAVWVKVVDANTDDGMQWMLDSKGRVPVFEGDDVTQDWAFVYSIPPHNGWYASLVACNIVDERL